MTLPSAWGSPDEWAISPDGLTFLRVADFANKQDARLFNRWCEADYKIQAMRKDATNGS